MIFLILNNIKWKENINWEYDFVIIIEKASINYLNQNHHNFAN